MTLPSSVWEEQQTNHQAWSGELCGLIFCLTWSIYLDNKGAIRYEFCSILLMNEANG